MTDGNNFEKEYIPKTGVNPETVQPMIDLREFAENLPKAKKRCTPCAQLICRLCPVNLSPSLAHLVRANRR